MLLELGRGISPRMRKESGAAPAYLDGVIASAVFDLDATAAASYPGAGTTWSNLVASPADGSAQTDYDFYTGDGSNAATYPAFNGSAGDPAAYWEFDGGDYFNLKSGANTAFINSLHKTTGGADFWIAFTARIADAASALGFCTTQSGTTGQGLRLEQTSSEFLTLRQRGDSANSDTSVGPLSAGTDYILIFSHSHSGNASRKWVNSAASSQSTHTFNTTTTDTTAFLRIAARLGNSSPLPSGTRMYSFAMGNEYLDDTKAAAIIAHLEARHGRDYTP